MKHACNIFGRHKHIVNLWHDHSFVLCFVTCMRKSVLFSFTVLSDNFLVSVIIIGYVSTSQQSNWDRVFLCQFWILIRNWKICSKTQVKFGLIASCCGLNDTTGKSRSDYLIIIVIRSRFISPQMLSSNLIT